MTKVEINPGVCGLKTTVRVTSGDMQNAAVEIQSDCPHVQKMQEELTSLDAYTECFARIGDSKVYQAAQKHCRHGACPAASGILKGIEVECGLALPREVHMVITKE